MGVSGRVTVAVVVSVGMPGGIVGVGMVVMVVVVFVGVVDTAVRPVRRGKGGQRDGEQCSS